MRYYIIERSPWICRFSDDGCLSEYVNGDYAEDRNYPEDDLILREDGVLCRILPTTVHSELVEFEETLEMIELGHLNQLVSKLCIRFRLPVKSVASLEDLCAVLDVLCARKDQLQRRFDRLLILLVASILGLPVAYIVFRSLA
jgi:hypothetical protein